MRPRPDILTQLRNTATMILSGARNPGNPVNFRYFYKYGLSTFLNYVSDAGIKDSYDDVNAVEAYTFKHINGVTNFLLSQMETGKLSPDAVKGFIKSSFNHFIESGDITSDENLDFIQYIERFV